ncbi:MAG: DUF763 domain-containing protein [Candidatus Bathyarchaeota archaeon]|nr:MAG: DUF763 domain-containing protein [Candidatus Bathyarchaeota archaeon]
MYRTGVANLPLHGGKAPAWLTVRMRKMAEEIADIMIDTHGTEVFLTRLSDPYWFQALGCVLAYDWHSSGVTTVLTGVLKQALSLEKHGIVVCGGKGATSRKTPVEIAEVGEKFGFAEDHIKTLTYTSKMTAKVDNTAIQAGYQLYHHAFLLTENKKWAVIQQGMSAEDRSARRYHWLSGTNVSLIVEPHNAIVGDVKREKALNMTAKKSEGARKASVDIAKEPAAKVMRLFEATRPLHQKSLQEWLPKTKSNPWHQSIEALDMPRKINWETMKRVYEFQPKNYEELLSVRGVGPATVRGLALVAELIYGEKPSWADPVKFSFAYGGKDGVPFPVDRRAMDESIQMLKQMVQAAKIGDKEKTRSLQRLRRFVPENANSYVQTA